MKFMRKNPELETMFSVFADDVYSELKDGVTQEDILNIENDFARILAQQIFDGTYEKNYRVASYEPYLHYDVLSRMWCTAGKRYSQREGVTGINISKGKHAIVVSGIPEGETVQLNVTAWYVGKIGGNFDGGNPETTTFALKNGINVIDYGMVLFEYDSGVSFAKTCSVEKGGFARRQLVVTGTNGTVELKPLEMHSGTTLQYTGVTEYLMDDPAWNYMGKKRNSRDYDRYDDMMRNFAKMVRGEIANPYSLDYEFTLYKTILESCQI
jgi:hypothetical protein